MTRSPLSSTAPPDSEIFREIFRDNARRILSSPGPAGAWNLGRGLSGLVHLLPQHGRDVVIVDARPVGAEAVRVVAALVGDGFAVEGHVERRLRLFVALGRRRGGENRS